jgi:hypothetical protein
MADPLSDTFAQLNLKRTRGQYYSSQAIKILTGLSFTLPEPTSTIVIEPFAGQGDLIEWAKNHHGYTGTVECYDIDPKVIPNVQTIQRNTLLDPPDYTNKYVLTNPPFLAGNKSSDAITKRILKKYDTDDLFKAFILSICLTDTESCVGGTLILPVGFFLSMDKKCRDAFMTRYEIPRVNYFDHPTFQGTTISVVSFSFRKSLPPQPLTVQRVHWYKYSENGQCVDQVFEMKRENHWMVGGEVHTLPKSTIFGRVPAEPRTKTVYQPTSMYLNTTDRISLEMKPDDFEWPPIKHTDRSYARLATRGTANHPPRILTKDEQERLCTKFNTYIQEKSQQYWKLWIPGFMDGGRHRLPFDTAYAIANHLLTQNSRGE